MHENHGYDIVVLFHKRHGRGHTWDSFGTTGFSKDLLSKESKAGSSLKNIFRLGILNRMTQETNPDINPNTSTSTSTNISANPNSSTNTSANTNTNNANTSTSTHTRTNNTSTNTSSSTDTDNEVSTGLDSGSNTHSGKRIVLINEGNCVVVVGWHCNSIG